MSYAISHRSKQPGKIYYEDIGEQSLPIMVMQHGDGNDSQNWKSLGYIEKLIPYFRLILIDYLGYGQSEKIYDPQADAELNKEIPETRFIKHSLPQLSCVKN